MTKSSTLKLTSEFFRRATPVILFMVFGCIVAAIPLLVGGPNLSNNVLKIDFIVKMGLVTLGVVVLGLVISLLFFIFLPEGLKRSRQMLEWEEEHASGALFKPHNRNLTNEQHNKSLKSDS